MIDAFSSSADAAKAIQTAVDCDVLPARRYGSKRTLIERCKITGEVTDDLWAKVMQDDAFTPRLGVRSARVMVGRLARVYWASRREDDPPGTKGTQPQQRERDIDNDVPKAAPIPSPPVTAVRRARGEAPPPRHCIPSARPRVSQRPAQGTVAHRRTEFTATAMRNSLPAETLACPSQSERDGVLGYRRPSRGKPR